jgi:hypothetical protein
MAGMIYTINAAVKNHTFMLNVRPKIDTNMELMATNGRNLILVIYRLINKLSSGHKVIIKPIGSDKPIAYT